LPTWKNWTNLKKLVNVLLNLKSIQWVQKLIFKSIKIKDFLQQKGMKNYILILFCKKSQNNIQEEHHSRKILLDQKLIEYQRLTIMAGTSFKQRQ
jgi:hypothetical protein